MQLPGVLGLRAARYALLVLSVLLSGTGHSSSPNLELQPSTVVAGSKPRTKPKNQSDPKENPEPLSPPVPTPEKQREFNKRCQAYYVRCRDFVEGDKDWRLYGETQCRSCFILCQRSGVWPAKANEKTCPGD